MEVTNTQMGYIHKYPDVVYAQVKNNYIIYVYNWPHTIMSPKPAGSMLIFFFSDCLAVQRMVSIYREQYKSFW